MSRGLPPAVTAIGTPRTAGPVAATTISTIRALDPGGEMMSYLQSREIEYFERTWRILGPNGIYSATPHKPVSFTMGAYRVSQSQVLVILDYAFNIYQPSGIAAGDYVPVLPNRLPTQVMWDIKVDEKREGQNIQHQVIPQVQAQNQQAFASANVLANPQQWEFDAVRAAQLQGSSGPATAGMPQRRHRDGLVKVANQYVARSSTTFNVTCSIINPISIPIAFFEANVMGILLPQNVYDAYQAANAPTGNPQIPVMIAQSQEPR